MSVPRSIVNLFPNVTKCTDAKLPVSITVKEKDVTGAKKKDFGACAMANAICREWRADAALIGLSYSYVIKGNHAVRFVTPETVSREITAFDRNKSFVPGKYHLAAIPKSQRRNKPSGPRKARKSHQPKRKVFHTETLGVRQMRTLGTNA